jgi:rhamnosyltransferase subunit B
MRLLITTFGSLGDLFPYIAVAKELQQRGVSVAIASTEDHKPYLDLHGVEFVPMGVNVTDMLEHEPHLMRKIMDRDNGSEYVLRHLVMGNLRRNYDDLMKATDGVDLLVTHTISYATILVARKKNIPFVGTILSPLNYWSKYDPPVMPGATFLPTLHRMLGTPAVSFVMNRMKNQIYSWGEEYRKLQSELGLEVDRRNIFFEGQFSPLKNLGLFSPLFGPPQQDWPSNAVATGFPFLDTDFIPEDTRQQVRDFLKDGPAPVVFTLGSSAVWDAGDFYVQSVEALKQLNLRGVLLVGMAPDKKVPTDLPPSVIAVDYLPHNLIFRHASAVVHQGGVGTTAQALRAGVPQLVVPWAHDQLDNAARVARLGCGVSVERSQYNAKRAVRLVAQICSQPYRTAAQQIGEKIDAERAADEIILAAKLQRA